MVNIAGHITGLSSSEVNARVEQGQRNHHVVRPTRTYLQIIWANVFSLYNVILLGSFAALFILRGPGSSIFPAGIVLINVILGTVQEIRAKRALDKLATLSVRSVTVRRNGVSATISIDDIVRDDVIELHPGDSIVVDGAVLASESLEIDESQLTGESEYVPKQAGDDVVSGSFCVSGAGLMQADLIGNKSYVNSLAEVARTYRNIRTPLEQQLDKLVTILVAIMIVLAPLTLLAGDLRGVALADSVENVVNLMSSLVPQGLIVFVSISFAFGVLNISRFRALIQRPNAVELMGHITCLCVDKTGTITRNQLSVREVIPVGGMSAEMVQDKLARYVHSVSWQNRTVEALAAFIAEPSLGSSKVAEVPFNSERKWSSVTYSSGETLILGAPEIVLGDAALQAEAERMASQGLRILAFATSEEAPSPNIPLSKNTECLALIVLRDQIRPDTNATLKSFAEQGIAIKIISGDSPETIKAVAQEAGMGELSLLTGQEVAQMDEIVLGIAATQTSLFARITPQAKRRIVAALAMHGPVAMIGDGVNDVPALKQANLAIAMNDGAQIAKDVSDIILLDNAFATLPRALFEGREITQRLYGIAKINLAKVAYLTVLFVLAGYVGLPWPANLLQTTWLSLVTLTIPAMLIIFRILPIPLAENKGSDVIRYVVSWGMIGALAMLILDIVVIVLLKESVQTGRTMVIAFAGLYNSMVLWDIYHVTSRSKAAITQNWKPALAGLILGLLGAFVPAYLIPQALALATLGSLDLISLAIALGLSFVFLRFLGVQSK